MLIYALRKTFILYTNNEDIDYRTKTITVNKLTKDIQDSMIELSTITTSNVIWRFKSLRDFENCFIKYMESLNINNPKIIDPFIYQNYCFSKLSDMYTEADPIVKDKKYIMDGVRSNTTNNDKNIEYIKLLPMEYFINMIDSSKIAYDKYYSFRSSDIMLNILKLGLYMFNNNIQYPKIFYKLLKYRDKVKLEKYITDHPELEDELKSEFDKYGFDSRIFTKDLNEFVNLKTTLGYSSFGIFKFNRYLVDFVRKTNYKIRM